MVHFFEMRFKIAFSKLFLIRFFLVQRKKQQQKTCFFLTPKRFFY